MIGTFKDGKATPGATILSGVFNQDGSNSPYLQPLLVNFNPENKTMYVIELVESICRDSADTHHMIIQKIS